MAYAMSPDGFRWIDNIPGVDGHVTLEYEQPVSLDDTPTARDVTFRRVIYTRQEIALAVYGPVPPWERFTSWPARLDPLWGDVYVHPDVELNDESAKRLSDFFWPCGCGCMNAKTHGTGDQ